MGPEGELKGKFGKFVQFCEGLLIYVRILLLFLVIMPLFLVSCDDIFFSCSLQPL